MNKHGFKCKSRKEYDTKYNEARKEYSIRLKIARDNFLKVFFEDESFNYVPSKNDLLSVVIIQNLEILDLLRQNKA